MAKDQTAQVLSVSEGDKITVVSTFGKFLEFRHVFFLKECRVL